MASTLISRKAQISSTEMERRRVALQHVQASSRLEGQYSSPESNKVFESFVQGEIDLDEIAPLIKGIHKCP